MIAEKCQHAPVNNDIVQLGEIKVEPEEGMSVRRRLLLCYASVLHELREVALIKELSKSYMYMHGTTL